MSKLKKLFGETNISVKFIILFSVLTGVIVGILNSIPALKNTSFQDIAIYLDMWFVLAVFIITNCHKRLEAVTKTFLFFLISQPVIYLVEVIAGVAFFKADFIETAKTLFINYYWGGGTGWLLWTVLTIPGAFVAYQIKDNSLISGIVLSVATVFLAYRGADNIVSMIINKTAPYHLLNGILCIGFAFLLVFIILSNKKAKTVAVSLTAAGLAVGIIYTAINLTTPVKLVSPMIYDFGIPVKVMECVSEDENIATVTLSDDKLSMMVDSSEELGETKIIATDSWGIQHIYKVVVTNSRLDITEEGTKQ